MKQITFITIVLALLLASFALAAPTARLSPPSVTLVPNQQGSLDIVVTADSAISSVTVEGTFDPAAITPTVQVTAVGPVEAWGDQGSSVSGTTWRLVASRGGKTANKLPAGTHTVGRISFTSSASTTLTMTSAVVGTAMVSAADLAGATITVQATTAAPEPSPAATASVSTAQLSPSSVSLTPNQQGSLDIVVTAGSAISSVTVEGTFDPAAITPTVQVTAVGSVEAWGDQGSSVSGTTWRLVASRGGKTANKLPAGTHTVGRISFTSSASTTLTMTSALVGTFTVSATNLAGATITVTGATPPVQAIPECTNANWQVGEWSDCVGACDSQGTQTRTVTKVGDCQSGVEQPVTSLACSTPACSPSVAETGGTGVSGSQASKAQALRQTCQSITDADFEQEGALGKIVSKLAKKLKDLFG